MARYRRQLYSNDFVCTLRLEERGQVSVRSIPSFICFTAEESSTLALLAFQLEHIAFIHIATVSLIHHRSLSALQRAASGLPLCSCSSHHCMKSDLASSPHGT